MNYKNAWKCHKCPSSNAEGGCPAWVEFMAKDIAGGQETLKKMCLFQALPIFLVETLKASNRPAAAIESMRNEIVNSVYSLQDGLVQAVLLTNTGKALPLGLLKGDYTDASTETHKEGEYTEETTAMGARKSI